MVHDTNGSHRTGQACLSTRQSGTILNGRSNPLDPERPQEASSTMAITEFDLGKIDELIANEEATLEPKHAESIAYRAIADRHVAGGVASSWQDSPPHAIFADHGQGSRLWDIDGNEYIDFHL
ncbi:MAG TPA: hypothetical protein VNG34_12260, partial [Actinomycetota bacterium]|nr:hypothetical protein [Actinomycetota bacterium]